MRVVLDTWRYETFDLQQWKTVVIEQLEALVWSMRRMRPAVTSNAQA